MNDTSISSFVLKMKKPIFPFGRIYPGSLMRTVNGRFTLRQHHFSLVRAIDIFGFHHHLPTGSHSACRCKNVIFFVTFVKFRPFDSRVISMSVVNGATWCDGFRSFRIHFKYCQNALNSGTTSRIGMRHIRPTVLIPKRTRVNQPFAGLYHHGFRPFSGRIFGFHHVNPEIRVTPIDVKFIVMKTDGRRPNSVAMLNGRKYVLRFEPFDSMTN